MLTFMAKDPYHFGYPTGIARSRSREPNIQNLPVRTELGRRLLEAYQPRIQSGLSRVDYRRLEQQMAGTDLALDIMLKQLRDSLPPGAKMFLIHDEVIVELPQENML